VVAFRIGQHEDGAWEMHPESFGCRDGDLRTRINELAGEEIADFPRVPIFLNFYAGCCVPADKLPIFHERVGPHLGQDAEGNCWFTSDLAEAALI